MNNYPKIDNTFAPLLKDWLSLGKIYPQAKGLENYLINHKTDLPLIPLLTGRIKEMQYEGEISLLYMELSECNDETSNILNADVDSIEQLSKHIVEIKRRYLRRNDLLAELVKGSNSLIIILSPPRTSREISKEDLTNIAARIRNNIEKSLRKNSSLSPHYKPTLHTGFAFFQQPGNAAMETALAIALEQAIINFKQSCCLEREERAKSIESFLKVHGLTTILSPIFDLKGINRFGWRIMCYGPNGKVLTPYKLFSSIKEKPSYYTIYPLYLKHIMRSLEDTNRILFFHIDPDILNIPEMLKLIRKYLSAEICSPSRIVLELDTISVLNDPDYYFPTARFLRGIGFGLAFIGVGSLLEAWEIFDNMSPDYLIIDPLLFKPQKCNSDLDNMAIDFKHFADIKTKKSPKIIFEIGSGNELEVLHKSNANLMQIINDSTSYKSRASSFLTSFISTAS